jgi:peptidoglycan L-alanyl-D-glutamate endopeptidase CwlK
MRNFTLSTRSLRNLNGVSTDLQNVVKRAIDITTIDFGVIEGLRTVERQKELVAKGASQTMNSRHILGEAVDVLAYLGSRGSWELNLYDDIADAFRIAGKQIGVGIRWGGAWNIPDITQHDSCSWMMEGYIDFARSRGKRPFIDAVHFELARR